jgi:hypothetical protein
MPITFRYGCGSTYAAGNAPQTVAQQQNQTIWKEAGRKLAAQEPLLRLATNLLHISPSADQIHAEHGRQYRRSLDAKDQYHYENAERRAAIKKEQYT